MSLKLADLEPSWYRVVDAQHIQRVGSFEEAQGVMFDCPAGDGHRILVWFADRGVPDYAEPRSRWQASGSSFADLTLAPSIDTSQSKCGDRPGWHGYVTRGEIA